VLRQRASEVSTVDGALVKVCERMIQTMYDAPGLGLAAPQVGIQKRLFVYDLHDGEGAQVLVNPVIKESSGEWTYDEGCLSVPGLSWEIVRPNEIHLVGYDLDGREVDVEVDELTSRLYQHELDHLDGKLLLDYLPDEDRADALRVLRNRILDYGTADDPAQVAARGATKVPRGARAGDPAPAKNRFGISLPGIK
jgi:peptide deformylase